ncbi:MAG: sulfatase [Verrucomicrobiota bacterium]
MIRSLLPLLLCLATIPCLASEAKPNFVIIFIDDMGYGDIEPFGSTINQTPHLSQMAKDGMKLTSFYAAPVCSASRAQLLTGSYAPRVSVPGVFFPIGPKGLNPDEHTIADYLKELGYATACVGKWHLGDQKEFLPTRHGFDSYYGIPFSNDMQRTSTETGKRVTPVLRDEEVEKLIEDEEQRLITREYTEEAVKFIQAQAAAEKPFFLYFPHSAIHTPIYPHPDFAGLSENGRLGDWITEVDWSVGEVLAALEESGVDENTLVVFTSDNGPWASKGTDGGVATPLRGAKGGTLEGGVREPTIVRWPGRIAPGSTSDAISGTTDLLPTLVALAGGSVRDDVKIDGFDLSEVLFGNAEQTARKAWYYFQGTNLKAVRSGPWKLAIAPQRLGMGLNENPADLARGGRLYNLDEEIGETTDLSAEHPEIVARLETLAEAMAIEVKENARPAGQVETPVPLYPQEIKQRGKKPKPAKPVDWTKVTNDSVLTPESAPQVQGRGFTVSCTIESDTEGAPKGVIIAHGGTSVGYSLYSTGTEICFAVRHSNNQVSRTMMPFTGNSAQLTAELKPSRELVLSLDQEPLVTAKLPGLVPRHPQENFSVGHDDRNQVDDLAPTNPFEGTITDISVKVGE